MCLMISLSMLYMMISVTGTEAIENTDDFVGMGMMVVALKQVGITAVISEILSTSQAGGEVP